mmetsp:Transcript_46189/g.75373  ORF Transcript_46189/g.75373 Transcript_46189/m.75373 type:complete len:228 (-) Transcript_46189:176-859(-)
MVDPESMDEQFSALLAWQNAFADLVPKDTAPDPISIRQELVNLRQSERKLQELLKEQKRRENSLVMRLSLKERDLVELQGQLEDLRQSITAPRANQARTFCLDPAVNAEFKRMKDEVKQMTEKLRKTQEDLEAAAFNPQAQTGRMLMQKVRSLAEENEEWSKQAGEGRLRDLEAALAVQKQIAVELKQSCADATEYVHVMEEEEKVFQTEIESLQRQVVEASNKPEG